MTLVNDNLLGTSVSSAKSGSKSAGKHLQMDAAKQRSAFENAFADAGKKKLPTIAISGKPVAENSAQSPLANAQNLKTAVISKTEVINKIDIANEAIDAKNRAGVEDETGVVSVGNTIDKPSVDTVEDDQSFLSRFVSEDDVVVKPAISTPPNVAALPVAETLLMPEPKQELTASDDGDRTQPSVLPKLEAKIGELPSISLEYIDGDATVGAGKTVDVAVGEKIADLVKDPRVKLSKLNDVKTDKSDQTSISNPPDDADVPVETTAAADVSQLLTLLSAAQKPAVASPVAQTQTTPAISEFHALADRAGKATTLDNDVMATKPEAQVATERNVAATPKDAASTEKNAATTEKNTGNATAPAELDQVFRFARADGKGQAVSMNIASDGDKAVIENDAPAANVKAETVTVLEARRYLGLATTSNASAVTSQIVSNPQWAQALQPSAEASANLTQGAAGKVLNTLKIQMHPIDLGTVTATLRLKDDELHVELKVETGDAFRQLSDDQNAMIKALRAQGFAVDQVNVVFNASDSSGGSTTQQQAQPQGGQQGRDAAADGSGQGQRNDNDGQQQSGGRWTGNEGTNDPSSGSESGRTGDVYM